MGEQNSSFLLDRDNIVDETRGGSLSNRYVYGVNLKGGLRMWLFKLFKSNRYEILIPPCKLDYDNWTKKQAEEYLNWFVAHVPERAAYVLKKATGKSLPEGPIPPEVLLDVWKWFLRVATTEPVPEEEQEAQRAAFGHFGEDFINKEVLSLQTEFIIRDIAMLMSAVFTTNYPVLFGALTASPRGIFLSISRC